MNVRPAFHFILTLLSLLPKTGLAEPTVIHDSGKTRPITDFVRMTPPQTPPSPPTLRTGHELAAQFLAGLFPVETPELTPGRVVSQKVDLHLPQPFFLIGSDPMSQQWLRQYRDKLAQLHAMGLVVNVATVTEFQELQELAGNIPLTPAPGSDLVQSLQGVKLGHYPVLITRGMIEQ
jgi:integrating conjugative element protein (TIGR03765 family)